LKTVTSTMAVLANLSQLSVEQCESALIAVACVGGLVWGKTRRMKNLRTYALSVALPACVALGFEIARDPRRALVLFAAPMLLV
jgi:hypothetical protein